MADVAKVSAGKPTAGMISVDLTGEATLPTDATTDLTGFTSLGYISEDGVTNENSPDTDKIKSWGGATVLTVQNEKSDTFKFTMLEALNENVLKVIYGGDNVTTTSGLTTVKATAAEAETRAYVIEMLLTGNVPKRIVIPKGKLTDLGEIKYDDGDAIGYEVTIEALPDSSEVNHYEYIGETKA